MQQPRQLFAISHLVGDRLPEEIAADLAVSTRTVQRWMHRGIDWQQADRFAVKVLGSHPLNAFGPEWSVAAEQAPDRDDARLQFIR